MDWWGGKVSLGSLDLAGAVNKLQESVKNIEKNFDNALGLEDKSPPSEGSTSWSSPNRKALFDSAISFMGQKEEEDADESKDKHTPQDDAGSAMTKDESPEQSESTKDPSLLEGSKFDESDVATNEATDSTLPPEEGNTDVNDQENNVVTTTVEEVCNGIEGSDEIRSDEPELAALPESTTQDEEPPELTAQFSEEEKSDVASAEQSESGETKVPVDEEDQDSGHTVISMVSSDDIHEKESVEESTVDRPSPVHKEMESDSQDENQMQHHESSDATKPTSPNESASVSSATELPRDVVPDVALGQGAEGNNAEVGTGDIPKPSNINDTDAKHYGRSSTSNVSDFPDAAIELEKLKKELKMMEDALQCAAKQAYAKADEITKLMIENEQLKSTVEDLRRKSSDAEIESLREEYHQRVATLERKVYALTKERDTLRREQSKRTDAAALLKEKDEIINQVMAEGEELSKKQAAQEAQIRKLRAQIRELEEEKKSSIMKLQLEENKVESIKKDKAATEKLLQETIEKHQADMAVQKEYYTNALNAAKEAEALAEARANDEARSEIEGRLREAEERETMLVQALEELRLTLSRQDQQAIDKEDSLRRDIEDLKKRYQASERRCEELITQLPESTRPLLRQIEAMQEASSRKAEAWAAVERTLQSRLQEAEAKAAAAEERERSINERLSQTLSRINVLEAQISCLRAEQTQLNRSLEKERQRAAENRQEYLAAKEVADTHGGRANQLEEEIRELKRKHKTELQKSLAHQELLQQELEREKAAKLDLEKAARLQSTSRSDQSPTLKNNSAVENGKLTHKLSSASSVGNMEESFFLQASLESSGNLLERRNSGEITMSPYYLKSMTPNAFEASLRQKEGELASYMTRLTSMESIRDSLAEELVKMTEQCEKLRTEATMLPGIRAELDSLRRRHSAALELMGERDEELEELRADIVDLKEMYREQVNLLVNKIQVLSTQFGAAA